MPTLTWTHFPKFSVPPQMRVFSPADGVDSIFFFKFELFKGFDF